MNIAVYFDIPVIELERAINFYGSVFDIQLERADIDGNDMLAEGAAEFKDCEGNRIALSARYDRTV